MNENDNIQATNNMDDKINIWMKIKNILWNDEISHAWNKILIHMIE
jgi:hypothetical protein